LPPPTLEVLWLKQPGYIIPELIRAKVVPECLDPI